MALPRTITSGNYTAAFMAADGVITGTVLTVDMWGGGGRGGGGSGVKAVGGSWGRFSYTVTSGDVSAGITLTIGAGATVPNNPGTDTIWGSTVVARVIGGGSANSNTGLSSSFVGGAGGTLASGAFGGGGAAGPHGAGNAGGTGTTAGGAGDAGSGGAGGAGGAPGNGQPGTANANGGGGGGGGTVAGGTGGLPSGAGGSGTNNGSNGSASGQIIILSAAAPVSSGQAMAMVMA